MSKIFIKVNDIRLNVVSFGTGQITFLALGGFVGSWELWQQPFEQLSKFWRCVGYDHRGAGESPVPSEIITQKAMVDDVFAIMDKLQIEKCVLAGESYGGAIAIMAVLRQPDRFNGLVLIGSDNPNPISLPEERKQFIVAMRANYRAAMKGFVQLCTPEPDIEHIRRWGLGICLRTELEAAIRLLKINSEEESNYLLSDITIPTLVIHGSKDVIIPLEQGKHLASVIPEAELVIIEGAGHVPTMTRPYEVVDAIKRRFHSLV